MMTDHRHTDLEERIEALERREELILQAVNNLAARIEVRFDAQDQRLEDLARHLGVPKANGRA